MRECLECGKVLPRRSSKGHREREYCDDRCRKRASRKRNKLKHDLDRLRREADERFYLSLYQGVHKEGWQDERERLHQLVGILNRTLDSTEEWRQYQEQRIEELREYIATLENQIADQTGEITKLTVFLESQAKRKR